MQNGDSIYSYNCNIEKYNPNTTVIIILWIIWLYFLQINALWAHVIVIPDLSKIIVFNKGILIGLNEIIPFGGHNNPISKVGDNLLWKNDQKKEAKNKTSDKINKIIPIFILEITFSVCNPWNVDSRITSRHHWIIVNKIIIIPAIISSILSLWNHITIPERVVINPIDPVKGQGLLSTKWNGW